MKKRNIMMAVLILAGSTLLASGCGIGQKDPALSMVTTDTPAPTATPEPTPTPVSNLKGKKYTAEDGSFTITVPNKSWKIKAEEENLVSLSSKDQGTILIEHGKGEDALSAVLIPDTFDLAVTMEQAGNLSPGVDFEIPDYSIDIVGGTYVYDYTVHYMNAGKNEGVAYTVNHYLLSDNEYYSIIAKAKSESYLADVRESVETFHILTNSPLAAAAPGKTKEEKASSGQADSADTTADSSVVSQAPASSYEVSDGYYTEEQLESTYQTRTIYRNSDGTPIVIEPDGEGTWYDAFGNSYYFANEEDVYDQNDVDYYWHGEAGDVAFMPVE
ncbi:MAG: hypothetical protein IJ899_12665 [Blautia sp.]|nr:hypothetical protein [Blautia sp.]